jgi:hypothetical protein
VTRNSSQSTIAIAQIHVNITNKLPLTKTVPSNITNKKIISSKRQKTQATLQIAVSFGLLKVFPKFHSFSRDKTLFPV